MTDNQPQEALEVLTTTVSSYQSAFASEKRRIYCAMFPQQRDLYLADGAKDGIQAVVIGPNYCRALLLRGVALTKLGRGPEALADFDRAAALSPRDPSLITERSLAYQAMKDWPAMIETCERGEALIPNVPVEVRARERSLALRCEGYALLQEGKVDEGKARFQSALAADPTDRASANELAYLAKQKPDR